MDVNYFNNLLDTEKLMIYSDVYGGNKQVISIDIRNDENKISSYIDITKNHLTIILNFHQLNEEEYNFSIGYINLNLDPDNLNEKKIIKTLKKIYQYMAFI